MAAQSDGRIRVERRELADAAGVPAHAVHAGPGLIALIAARGAFGEPPDVVLSGINHGANVGRAIVHSGTVGAALTGGLHGSRAMAVSLDVGFAPETFGLSLVSMSPVQSILPPGVSISVITAPGM